MARLAIKLVLIFASVLYLFLTSCAKNKVDNSTFKSTEYVPYQKGNIRDYEVDSTSYDWASGKVLKYRFLVRETVVDTFRDLSGELAYRLEQFVSTDTGKSYLFYRLNSLKINSFGMERVENNQRILRMVFPITDKKKWDGNLYNALGAQEFRYTGVAKPYVSKYNDYPDCVFVRELDDSTFISSEKKNQIYAKDVGLVYKLEQDVKYKLTGEPQGYFVEWRLKKYWVK